MVKFLLAFDPQKAVPELTQEKLAQLEAWWSQSRGLLNAAASSGDLMLVKWVQANFPGESALDAINHFRILPQRGKCSSAS